MSVKRQATTELNHENWDQDDPSDQEEETGGFKMASKEVLEKRVIRTAKRRSQATGDEAKRSVFSGFSGFNKTHQTSFDFLSKLTNGNNGSSAATSKNEALPTTNSMSQLNTTTTGSLNNDPTSISGTSTPLAKSTFGKSPTESLFGTGTSSGFSQSVFTSSKPSTTVNDSPFKIQANQNPIFSTGLTTKSNSSSEKLSPSVPSNIFGSAISSSTAASNAKSVFGSTSNNSTPVKSQSVSSSQPTETDKSSSNSDNQDDNKLIYYNKLKGLNESVSAWIKKHVEETPLCILTPIFKDYEKYLKEIQDDFEKGKEKAKITSTDNKQNSPEVKNTTSSWSGNTGSSLFSSSSNTTFSNTKGNPTSPEKTSNLSMGFSTSTNTSANNFSTTSPPSTGFSFGIKPSSTNTSPFAINSTTTTTNSNGSSAPFSFGIGKPFSFSSNVQKTEESVKDGDENEDEPPKVEYTPIVEENSVYDKKCKIFVKKDGNFIDKGVGTLYIKKIEESGKHQLLVRANTSLGNVLLNLILGSSVPTQRMGKNNVMMVCIPTPDAKPPPTSILIRVKTTEEADELLETLNKYKA